MDSRASSAVRKTKKRRLEKTKRANPLQFACDEGTCGKMAPRIHVANPETAVWKAEWRVATRAKAREGMAKVYATPAPAAALGELLFDEARRAIKWRNEEKGYLICVCPSQQLELCVDR